MNTWVFTLVYQEAALIAYWVRHYRRFCDRIIVFVDVDSTDNTAAIAAREGAEVRPYDSNGSGLDDNLFVNFANHAYKEAVGKADWVIWADGDELLYAPDITSRLEQMHASGVTLPHLDYYVMSSDGLPTHSGQIYDVPAFRRGFFVQAEAKVAIFDPNLLHVHWTPGKHNAQLIGNTVRDSFATPLKMLHYRWLGEQYLRERDAQNYARLSPAARYARHGTHVWPEFIHPYHPMWSGPRPEHAQNVLD